MKCRVLDEDLAISLSRGRRAFPVVSHVPSARLLFEPSHKKKKMLKSSEKNARRKPWRNASEYRLSGKPV